MKYGYLVKHTNYKIQFRLRLFIFCILIFVRYSRFDFIFIIYQFIDIIMLCTDTVRSCRVQKNRCYIIKKEKE